MRSFAEVTYRNEHDAPTEPGWYYGKFQTDEAMQVCRVDRFAGKLQVNGSVYVGLENYRWFGPVPVCAEG